MGRSEGSIVDNAGAWYRQVCSVWWFAVKLLLVLMRLNASSKEKVLRHVGSARGDIFGDGGVNLFGHCRGRTQGTKTDSSNLLLALSIRSSAWLQRKQASISGSSRRLPTKPIHSRSERATRTGKVLLGRMPCTAAGRRHSRLARKI